jgi:Phospholipase_D-nuclease N-terminal
VCRWNIDYIKITLGEHVLFEGGFTFTNFVADAFAVFMFILWFWLLITISGDLFRRHDVSGFGKVLWVILLIVLPYIGIFAYIFTQGRGMAERNEARAKEARDELRQGVGFSAADEIEKLNRLKSTGSISEQEYARLRARIVQ